MYSEDLSEILTSLMKLNMGSKKRPLLSALLASEMYFIFVITVKNLTNVSTILIIKTNENLTVQLPQ